MSTNAKEGYKLTFVARIASVSVKLLFKLLLTYFLSKELFASFSVWLVKINFIALLTGLGLNISLMYYAKDNNFSSFKYLKNNVQFFILSFPIILLFVNLFFGSFLEAIFLTVGVFTLNVFQSINASLLVRNKYIQYFLLNLFYLIPYIILLIISFFDKNIGENYLKLLYISGGFFIVISYFFKDFSSYKLRIFNISKDFNYFIYGIKGLALNFLGQALYVSDLFIMEYFKSKNLADYVIAGSFVQINWFISNSLGTTLFSRIVQQKKSNFVKNEIIIISQISLVFNIIFTFLFAIFGNILILALNENYIYVYDLTLILLCGSHGVAIYKLMSRKFAAENKWSFLYTRLGAIVLLNLILNIFLVDSYGAYGAALSSLLCYLICGLLMINTKEFSYSSLLIPNITKLYRVFNSKKND
ncbi:lipopolysaccharide biosynthesis protein [Aurantibacter sp.]|uniref:lipopolysaccharide biosynthesis protein n=1 Tax=Aurantibacter sp. TaxID=2807103 RepID=UPI0035C7C408